MLLTGTKPIIKDSLQNKLFSSNGVYISSGRVCFDDVQFGQ